MSNLLKIEMFDDAAIDARLDADLRGLLSMSFPKDVCFRERRFWKHPPLYRAIILDGGGALAANVSVHRRTLGTTAGDLLIGGIGDVCVRSDCRGRGYVRTMLNRVHAHLAERGYAFAMLFGATGVYASSGYRSVDNPIRYVADAPGGVEIVIVQSLDFAMIRPLAISAAAWPAGEIDLRGPLF